MTELLRIKCDTPVHKLILTELSQVNIYLRKIESKDSDESYDVLDIHSFINASI